MLYVSRLRPSTMLHAIFFNISLKGLRFYGALEEAINYHLVERW